MITAQQIEFIYRLLLGRPPDPEGLAHYLAHASAGLSLSELRDSVLLSEEFRKIMDVTLERTVLAGDALVVVNPVEPEFGRYIAAHGNWEPHVIHILKQELAEGDTFIDVGANVGVMLLNAAMIVGPKGRAIGFEPHPDNIRALLKGIAANTLRNVTLHGFGLSAELSFFSLFGSSNGYLMPSGLTPFQTVSIPGDLILGNEERIDLIKIDVEGHEPHVLTGLQHTLKSKRPRVLCEFNPRCLAEHVGAPPMEFAKQLFDMTSTMTVIEYDGTSHNVNSATSLMDLWSDKNRAAVADDRLPDGMLHFDILFKIEG